MGICIGKDGKARRVRAAFIGAAGEPLWSVSEVNYFTTQYMTKGSAKLYDGWDRWPIDENGHMIAPGFTGTAWALFGSYDGLVYWKAQDADQYLNEFKSAKLDEATGLAEVDGRPHGLSCRIPALARRIRKGYIGRGGKACLFYFDRREGDEV